jgi:hypothetical protein
MLAHSGLAGVMMLNKIAELVHTQGHCVLATCGGQPPVPHASLMAYAAAPDCAEFWLATPRATRKWRNLDANPSASLLIDDRTAGAGRADLGGQRDASPGCALTVSVRLLAFDSAADAAAARAALLARHPGLASFVDAEDVVLLRLKVLDFQLLTGLSEVFFIQAEKMLDARPRKA